LGEASGGDDVLPEQRGPDAGLSAGVNWPPCSGCSGRFRFQKSGKVEPNDIADEPAQVTIERLNLNDGSLVEMRKQAILETTKGLNAKAARSRLSRLRKAEDDGVELEPFCFVLVQALEAHIKLLEHIRNSSKS
jgi:hypothetical protein